MGVFVRNSLMPSFLPPFLLGTTLHEHKGEGSSTWSSLVNKSQLIPLRPSVNAPCIGPETHKMPTKAINFKSSHALMSSTVTHQVAHCYRHLPLLLSGQVFGFSDSALKHSSYFACCVVILQHNFPFSKPLSSNSADLFLGDLVITSSTLIL